MATRGPTDPSTPPRVGLTRDEVMTAREVAELLQMPVSTVYQLARRGEIPARRLGRTVAVSAAAAGGAARRLSDAAFEIMSGMSTPAGWGPSHQTTTRQWKQRAAVQLTAFVAVFALSSARAGS